MMDVSEQPMTYKTTIMYVDDYSSYDDDKALQGIEAWLEKWDGQYKIIKDHGSHNEIMIEMDLLCTKDAFDNLSDEFTCSTEWSRNEITEDEVVNGKGPRSKLREKQIRNQNRSEGKK